MTQGLKLPIDGDEKRALLTLCLIAAKQEGFLLQDEADLHNNRLLSLYKEWGGDGWAKEFKPMTGAFNADEAAQNFLGFLKAKNGEFAKKMEKRELKVTSISVTLSVPLGEKGLINYAMTAEPPPDSDKDELQDAFQWLLHEVINGYQQQLDRPLQLPRKKGYQSQSGDTANYFEFTSIVSKSEGGKRGFFVKGAPFVKWGVRVFPNILSAAGIDPETIDGEKWIAGKAIYTKKANGDPDLVVSIEKGGLQL